MKCRKTEGKRETIVEITREDLFCRRVELISEGATTTNTINNNTDIAHNTDHQHQH